MKHILLAVLVLCGVVAAVGAEKDIRFKEFSTKDHPKSQGLNVTITYPTSWKDEDGRRPHMLKTYSKEEGSILLSELIGIKRISSDKLSVHLQEFSKILTQISTEDSKTADFLEVARAIYYPDKVDECFKMTVDGVPVLVVFNKGTIERGGIHWFSRRSIYTYFYDDYMVTIMFAVGGTPERQNEVDSLYKKNLTLFHYIAYQTIFTTKWETKDIAPTKAAPRTESKLTESIDSNVQKTPMTELPKQESKKDSDGALEKKILGFIVLGIGAVISIFWITLSIVRTFCSPKKEKKSDYSPEQYRTGLGPPKEPEQAQANPQAKAPTEKKQAGVCSWEEWNECMRKGNSEQEQTAVEQNVANQEDKSTTTQKTVRFVIKWGIGLFGAVVAVLIKESLKNSSASGLGVIAMIVSFAVIVFLGNIIMHLFLAAGEGAADAVTQKEDLPKDKSPIPSEENTLQLETLSDEMLAIVLDMLTKARLRHEKSGECYDVCPSCKQRKVFFFSLNSGPFDLLFKDDDFYFLCSNCFAYRKMPNSSKSGTYISINAQECDMLGGLYQMTKSVTENRQRVEDFIRKKEFEKYIWWEEEGKKKKDSSLTTP